MQTTENNRFYAISAPLERPISRPLDEHDELVQLSMIKQMGTAAQDVNASRVGDPIFGEARAKAHARMRWWLRKASVVRC